MGKIGLKLAERSKSGIPRTCMSFCNGLDHLKQPLHESLEPLLRGYQVGFECGDTLYGFYCCHFYLSVFYFVGLPLQNLLRDTNSFSKEMNVYAMNMPLDLLRIYHQSVINLSSDQADAFFGPCTLNGSAMLEQPILKSGVQQLVEAMWFCKLILGIYIGDYEVVRDNFHKLVYERPPDSDGCMHYVNVLLWAEGYGAIMVARRTGKYRVLAEKRIQKIEQWVNKGNVNGHHFLLHLYAELCILKKKSTAIIKRAFRQYCVTASLVRIGGGHSASYT